MRLAALFCWVVFVFSWAGFSQTPQIIDGSATVGEHSSIAVVNSFPSIAYHDATNNTVKFVQADSTDGSTWGNDPVVIGSGGQSISLGVTVAQIPFVAYRDGLSLKFSIAADTAGSSWSIPSLLSGDTCFGVSTVRLSNNNFGVAFCDNSSKGLSFIESDDSTGLIWTGLPVAADLSLNVGQFPSMVLGLAATPSIVYRDMGNNELKFVRATIVDGSAWSAPVVIGSTTGASLSTHLNDGGLPEVVFWKTAPDWDVFHVRATAPDGSSWAAPFKLDDSRGYISATFIGSQPAVAYYGDDKDLKYILAIDATLNSWNPPVVLDSEGDVGRYTSVVENNSERAISYFDYTNRSLKFAVYTPTPTPTPTNTPTPTATPTPTNTPTNPPTPTPTATPTPVV